MTPRTPSSADAAKAAAEYLAICERITNNRKAVQELLAKITDAKTAESSKPEYLKLEAEYAEMEPELKRHDFHSAVQVAPDKAPLAHHYVIVETSKASSALRRVQRLPDCQDWPGKAGQ
jgi:hypothetical protein